jgi:hypothetical protein
MALYPSLFSVDDLFGYTRPSVYVISDAELKAYKLQQREREILALEELIDGHKTSITHLEKTIALLKDDGVDTSK